ncbi:hypothetical protein [Kaarinaea lacus]
MKKPQQQYLFNRRWIWLYSLLLFCTCCNNLYADEENESYEFELTPYLWAASISGTTAVSDDGSPPTESPPIDSDYNFFSLDNLDGVASATFTARKNRWGFLFDFLYVAYEDTLQAGTLLETTPRLEGLIIEYAGAYAPQSVKNLEVIAGIRQQNIDVSLLILNQNPEANVNWFDPFVGVIYAIPLKHDFSMSLRGDVGGFGIESDMAVNAEAMIRYQFGNTLSAKFGYRYLKVKFDDANLVYDIGLDGFLLGLGIKF